MEKTFEIFIESRCEQALLANEEYKELQYKTDVAYRNNNIEEYNELSLQLLTITENICYKRAIKDIYSFLINN